MFRLRPVASRLHKRLFLPQVMAPRRDFAVRAITESEAEALRGQVLRLDLPKGLVWWEEVVCTILHLVWCCACKHVCVCLARLDAPCCEGRLVRERQLLGCSQQRQRGEVDRETLVRAARIYATLIMYSNVQIF